MRDYLKRVNYRKLALDEYEPICAVCGFGILAVLEVCHLDHNRGNNALSNLAILCPNCHKMHDIELIPTSVVITLRDKKRSADWTKRMKDAGKKAHRTRRTNAQKEKRKWRLAGLKAAATRRRNAESKTVPAGSPKPDEIKINPN